MQASDLALGHFKDELLSTSFSMIPRSLRGMGGEDLPLRSTRASPRPTKHSHPYHALPKHLQQLIASHPSPHLPIPPDPYLLSFCFTLLARVQSSALVLLLVCVDASLIGERRHDA